MKTAEKKKTLPTKSRMADLWQQSLADDDFRFELKAQNVAVDLIRAISEAGFTQSQIAAELNWKPSRVSRILHSAPNITLRTLHEFATALGLEFDVIYRHPGERRAAQPWEAHGMLEEAISVCRVIDSLHDTAQANLTKSEAMLDTARQLVRRGWNAAKVSTPTKPVTLSEAA